MEYLFHVDWRTLLVPRLSILEMVIRGMVVYVTLCLLLRVVWKRQAGKVALSDLLVLTLVTGICRNPLIADSYSLSDGLGVVIVILGTSCLMDWLSYYSPWVHGIMHPDPVLLIRDGVALHEHLKNELLTEQQLDCKLRDHGVKERADVQEAWLENNGKISVIKKKTPFVQSGLSGNVTPVPAMLSDALRNECPAPTLQELQRWASLLQCAIQRQEDHALHPDH